jgi:hypothetical protein
MHRLLRRRLVSGSGNRGDKGTPPRNDDIATLSLSAIDVLFSAHRECFDIISHYSIGIPDFQPQSLGPRIVPGQDL